MRLGHGHHGQGGIAAGNVRHCAHDTAMKAPLLRGDFVAEGQRKRSWGHCRVEDGQREALILIDVYVNVNQFHSP